MIDRLTQAGGMVSQSPAIGREFGGHNTNSVDESFACQQRWSMARLSRIVARSVVRTRWTLVMDEVLVITIRKLTDRDLRIGRPL